MASRKEQKEALRREREERERAALEGARRRRLVGYGAGGAMALAAVVVVVVLLVSGHHGGGGGGGGQKGSSLLPSGGSVPTQRIRDLTKAAAASRCQLKRYKATSRAHITSARQKVHYSSNPPTSGRHYYVPASDGAYSKPPPDTAAVHALEHGRIDIWFKPRLPADQRAKLKALFDEENGYQLLLIPRPNMPYQLAATAWGRDPTPNGTGYLLGCPTMTDRSFDPLRAFIDAHRSQGPEPIP